MLVRLAKGDGHVASEVRARIPPSHENPPFPSPRRARQEICAPAPAQSAGRASAPEAEQLEAERRRKAEDEERVRRARLDALARRGEAVWREIETEIESRNSAGYERAADLLRDLKAIANERGGIRDFDRRLDAIREKHARKERFIERLRGLG